MSRLPAVESGGSLSDIILSKSSSAKKKARYKPGRKRNTVAHGERHGLVKVDKRAIRRVGRADMYRCWCDCGESTYLSIPELKDRREFNLGCLKESCTCNSREEKALFNPEISLRVQLEQVLDTEAGMVDSAWGGTAFMEDGTVDREGGIERALSDLLPQVDYRQKRWNLLRYRSDLPYSKENCYLVACQMSDINQIIDYGDTSLTVKEAADFFSVTVITVLTLIQQHGIGAELIQSLIEESLNE